MAFLPNISFLIISHRRNVTRFSLCSLFVFSFSRFLTILLWRGLHFLPFVTSSYGSLNHHSKSPMANRPSFFSRSRSGDCLSPINSCTFLFTSVHQILEHTFELLIEPHNVVIFHTLLLPPLPSSIVQLSALHLWWHRSGGVHDGSSAISSSLFEPWERSDWQLFSSVSSRRRAGCQ